MIEFVLLFGLGFLSATLVTMLIAPAIHARIVRYAENRLKATLPISPQEVRAQRDMARAVYAAENARTKQELTLEREKTVALQLKNDALVEETKRLDSEVVDLRMEIDNLDVEAAEARSRLRQEESHVQQLKAALEEAEAVTAAKDQEIGNLQQRLDRLTANADNVRIDLSTRDTEIENLKFRIASLRDERDTLRDDVRRQTARAKDAEVKLTQEEHRVQRLEDRLARAIADGADREDQLQRRQQEIARLKEKLKTANAENRQAARAARDAVSLEQGVKAAVPRKKVTPDDINLRELPPGSPIRQEGVAVDADGGRLEEIAEEMRDRVIALSEPLQSGDASNDGAIREEIAVIAGNMVALTAAIEGPSSPIRAMLSGKAAGDGKRESLAARSKKVLASFEEEAG